MEMNFCRRCGTALTHVKANEYVCSKKHTLYANNTPTTGIFFLQDDGKVLLARRAFEPRKGMLDTVGGFVDFEETAEHAIQREITEETGLTPDQYSNPVFLCTEVGHYPYGGESYPVLSVFFWSRLSPNTAIVAQDDVSEVVAVSLDDIDLNELHDSDVRNAILKLRATLRKES